MGALMINGLCIAGGLLFIAAIVIATWQAQGWPL
jgi:hypothetical protein